MFCEEWEEEDWVRERGVVGIEMEWAEPGREVVGDGREKEVVGEVRNGTGW